MSDQDQNIFNKGSDTPGDQPEVADTVQSTVTGVDTIPNTTDYADLLKSIVREDGTQKYASVEDAVKALQSSQEFITTLKEENSQFKIELEKRQSAEEIFEQIKTTQVSGQPSDQTSEVDIVETIRQLVPEVIKNNEAKATAASNLNSVVTKLSDAYGDKADAEFYGKGKALGLNQDQMNELASTSPSAVFKMLGIEETKISHQTLNSDVNTQAMGNQNNVGAPNLKFPSGATGKDFASAWKAAGDAIED